MSNNLTEFGFEELIWPCISDHKEDIELHWSNGDPFIIKPGERMILPKQLEFLDAIDKFDGVLYGGSMGSGKSYILRWALVKFLIDRAVEGHTGVRVGLFCSTYKAIEDRHIKLIDKEFPDWLGYYHGKYNEYRLYPEYGGGVIQFRNLDDADKYKSIDYAAIGVDEITEVAEDVFDFLQMRLRWPPLEHCPIFAATNPTGLGAAWVRRRFVGRQRDRAKLNPKTGYISKGFHFIQALPTDNPLLSKQYLDTLYNKPPKLRDAYFYGHWDVFEGQYFDLEDAVHRCKPFKIPKEWNKFMAIDYGYRHPCAALCGAVDPKGNLYIFMEHSKTKLSPTQNKEEIYRQLQRRGIALKDLTLSVGDPSMWKTDGSRERNKTPGEIFNMQDEYGSFQLLRADNERIAGWHALLEGFQYARDITVDAQGLEQEGELLKKPKIQIFDDCFHLWKSLKNLEHAKNNIEDVAKTTGEYKPGEGDDEADALRYLYMAAVKSSFREPETHARSMNITDPRETNIVTHLLNQGVSVWAL